MPRPCPVERPQRCLDTETRVCGPNTVLFPGCEIPNCKCAPTSTKGPAEPATKPAPELHNCYTREVWTAEKKKWCCVKKQIGVGCGVVTKPTRPAPVTDTMPTRPVEPTPVVCTREMLYCPGTEREMPRAKDCTWMPEKCPAPVCPTAAAICAGKATCITRCPCPTCVPPTDRKSVV